MSEPIDKSVNVSPSVPWLSKPAAALALGVSERTIDTMVAERKLGTRQQAMPGRRAATLVDPDDVARVAAEQRRGAILQPITATNAVQTASIPPDEALKVLARLSDVFHPPAPVKPKLFLSLGEAADYSGLPRGLLRRLIGAGRLPAEQYGNGRLFIRTADLDQISFLYLSEVPANRSEPLRKLRKVQKGGK